MTKELIKRLRLLAQIDTYGMGVETYLVPKRLQDNEIRGQVHHLKENRQSVKNCRYLFVD